MFVVLDMEWVEDPTGYRSLTQLYAARVDESWNTVRSFDALVRPQRPETAPWEHVAFNGYAPEEFCAAGAEGECVERFFRWLQPGDTLCCWQFETKNTLETLFRRSFSGPFSATVLCMNKKVRAIAERRGIRCFPLYQIAEAAGLTVPAPEHRSSCDVSVMLALFQTLELPQEPPQTQTPKPPLSRQERNEKIIAASSYTYLFSPASTVFHCRTCKQLLHVKNLLGTVYYETAAKKRRPCKLCHPELQVHLDRPAKARSEQRAAEAAPPQEPVKTRLLGNQYAFLPPARIVGCCHNLLHPGKMTKQLLKQHNCLGKDCRYFEKYENAEYWKECRRQEERKRAGKLARKQKKEQEAAAQTVLQTLTARFQSFADEAGYSMQIVRVDAEAKNRYRVFYVSENPFADGDCFPDFLDAVRSCFPEYRLRLRHIRDMDGHFVTIEEYQQRVRK